MPLAPELSELPLVVPPMLPPERVFTSAPASMPLERGRVAPRRPSGALEVVPARPPLFELQAPTPASIAAAEARVIHLLSFIGGSSVRVVPEACALTPSPQARGARKPGEHARRHPPRYTDAS